MRGRKEVCIDVEVEAEAEEAAGEGELEEAGGEGEALRERCRALEEGVVVVDFPPMDDLVERERRKEEGRSWEGEGRKLGK